MSHEQQQQIISKLQHTISLYEFLHKEYPYVLEAWKSKNAVVTSHSNSTASNSRTTKSGYV